VEDSLLQTYINPLLCVKQPSLFLKLFTDTDVQLTMSSGSWFQLSITLFEKLYLPIWCKSLHFKNLYKWPRPLHAVWNQFLRWTLWDLCVVCMCRCETARSGGWTWSCAPLSCQLQRASSTARLTSAGFMITWFSAARSLCFCLSDFDIFWRNVTNKVSNEKMFYYSTSNSLYFCTTW